MPNSRLAVRLPVEGSDRVSVVLGAAGIHSVIESQIAFAFDGVNPDEAMLKIGAQTIHSFKCDIPSDILEANEIHDGLRAKIEKFYFEHVRPTVGKKIVRLGELQNIPLHFYRGDQKSLDRIVHAIAHSANPEIVGNLVCRVLSLETTDQAEQGQTPHIRNEGESRHWSDLFRPLLQRAVTLNLPVGFEWRLKKDGNPKPYLLDSWVRRPIEIHYPVGDLCRGASAREILAARPVFDQYIASMGLILTDPHLFRHRPEAEAQVA